MSTDETTIPTEVEVAEQPAEVTPDYGLVLDEIEAKKQHNRAGFEKRNKEVELGNDDIEKIVSERVKSEVENLQTQLTNNALEEELLRLSDDPAKLGVVKHMYENRLTKRGTSRIDIRNDLQDALVLAEREALRRTNSELKVALQAKTALGTMGAPMGSNQDKPNSTADDWKSKFNKETLDYMTMRNFSEEDMRKVAQDQGLL